MARLEIRLFGHFEARLDDEPVHIPTRQTLLLLTLLAAEQGRAVSRASLAALLWPERSEEQSRTSMRQALYRLRGALEAADPFPLEIDPRWVRLKTECVDIDAVQLVEAMNDAAALEKALEQITGSPLDGVEGAGSETESRLATERTRLRRILLDGLERLSLLYSDERRYAEMEAIARRRLAIEPFDEAALRDLMTALARQGRRNAALDVYQSSTARLRAELSVAPSEATNELWKEIRQSKGPAAADDCHPPAKPRPEKSQAAETVEPAIIDASHIRHIAVLHIILPTFGESLMAADPEAAEKTAGKTLDQIGTIAKRRGGVQVGATGSEVTYAFGAAAPLERPALSAVMVGLDLCALGAICGLEAGDGLTGAGLSQGQVSHLARHLALGTTPGRMLLGPGAEAECRGALDLYPADGMLVPGLDAPLPRWHAKGDAARDGWAARRARGLSRFVGREEELTELSRLADRTADGGRVVVVTGEAGLGKSRLVHEFLLSRPDAKVHRVDFAAQGKGSGLFAFGSLVKAWVGLPHDAPAQDTMATAEERLISTPIGRDLLPAVAVLLDLPDRFGDWTRQSSERRRSLLAESIRAVLENDSRDAPAIFVVEDAHWADAEGVEVLSRLVTTFSAARLMMVVTARPEFEHDWIKLPHVRQIRLEGLRPDAAAVLVDDLLGNASAPADFRERLSRDAGGVPLYIEEVMRALKEADDFNFNAPPVSPTTTRTLGGFHIPSSIRGVLSLRIERLSEADRRVLQAAAVIGGDVSEALLASLSGVTGDALTAALDALSEANLLLRTQSFPERHYAFQHALTLEAAYRSILPSRRQVLHRAMLDLCDRRYADTLAEHVEEMADHARFGGLWPRAADLCKRAALQAEGRSSYHRAALLYDRALDALERQPQTDALRLEQADIHCRMRPALWMTGEYDRVVQGLVRAQEMSEQAGDRRLLAEIQAQRAYFHSTDGRFDEGLKLCRAAEVAAQGIDDALLHAEIAAARCQLLRFRGRYSSAVHAIEQQLHVWTGEHRHYRGLQLATRGVYVHSHLSASQAGLGHDEAARHHADTALAIARETERPADLYIAIHHGGQVALDAGRVEEALKLFNESLEIARTSDLFYFAAWAKPNIGEALLATGQVGRALDLLRDRAKRDHVVHELIRMQWLAALGKGLTLDGDPDGAKSALRPVIEAARRMEQPHLEQLALRRMALAMARRDDGAAAGLLREALAIALREGYAPDLARIRTHAAELSIDLSDNRDAPSREDDARP